MGLGLLAQGAWLATILGLFALSLAVRASPVRHGIVLGLLGGTVASAIALFWVPHAWASWREASPIAAWVMFLMFTAWHGGALAVSLAAASALARTREVAWTIALPIAITPIEAVWPAVFPIRLGLGIWGIGLPEQVADLGGVAALTLLISATAGMLADGVVAFRSRRCPPVSLGVAVVVLWVLALAWGAARTRAIDGAVAHSRESLTVLIVQPNVTGFDNRADPARATQRYADATLAEPLDGLGLVMWAESAVDARTIDLGARDLTSRWLQNARVPLLFGGSHATKMDGTFRVTNSVLLADTSGVISAYHDKAVPVPLAEAFPLERWFPSLGRGKGNRAGRLWGTGARPMSLGTWRLAPSICYEDVDEGMIRTALFDATPPADALVNIANDSWLGSAIAARQHLNILRIRAIESRRPVLRAASSGISAFIDPAGRIQAELPFGAPGVLRVAVPRLALPPPPWSFVGDGLVWACGGVLMVLLGLSIRRTRQGAVPVGIVAALCFFVAPSAHAQRKTKEPYELKFPVSGTLQPVTLHVGDRVEFKLTSEARQELRTLQVTFACNKPECSLRPTVLKARSAWAIGGGEKETKECHDNPISADQPITKTEGVVFLGITPVLRFKPKSDPVGRLMPIAREGYVFVTPEVGTLEFEALIYTPPGNNPDIQDKNATSEDVSFAERYWDAACGAAGGASRGSAPPTVKPKIGNPSVTLSLVVTRWVPQSPGE